jgi:hypothetical protein
MYESPCKVNDQGFIGLRLHRGCDSVNTNACLFAGTPHDCLVKLWVVGIVARFAIGIRGIVKSEGNHHFGSEERKKISISKRTCQFLYLSLTGIMFVVVFALLIYSIVEFRGRARDAGREPA